METLARKLCGETFTLSEMAHRCLDVAPAWIPETQFEQVHALYERILPDGAGSLAERARAYRQSCAFPRGHPKPSNETFEKERQPEALKPVL